MSPQTTFTVKVLSTDSTGVRRPSWTLRSPRSLQALRVPLIVDLPADLLVAPQGSGSREGLVADAAAVRLDPRVASHVRLHVLKGLPTDAAGAAGLPVRLQVGQQTIRGVQLLSTDPADGLGPPAVRLSVFPQEASAVEGLATDPAAQRPGSLIQL